MTILLGKNNLINGFFLANIIILPMLSYFQLLYYYYSINLNYFTLHYLWLFSITFGYFLLFHHRLLLVILSYLWLIILFHLRLFSAIVSFFGYCKLFQFRLLTTIINYLKVISDYVIIGQF
jgi:hypothetical protein